MVSLGYPIPPNPHIHIQQVEIVTLKEYILQSSLPQDLPSAFVSEITIEHCDLWYKKLLEYLKWNSMPPNLSSNEKLTFKHKASRYAILGDVVCKQSYDGVLLLCLELCDQQIAIQTFHDGIYGGHFNGTTIAKLIFIMGYYWPTMEKYYQEYIRKCIMCQQHSHLQHLIAQAPNPIQSLWPISQWGFDLIGQFVPPSLGKHKFIITMIEYFTKWVEVEALVSTTGPKIAKFINPYIIYHFGIPQKIISYNGPPFKNQHVRVLCYGYNIQYSFFTPCYPQGNGQAKASNKITIIILKTMVNNNHRNWHECLPYALWAYRTSIRMPTGATPFSLVYGAKAVMPLELEILSLKVQLQGLILDEEDRQARLDQLTILDEQ